MVDTVVFGGWAVEPKVLAPLFGKEACYIDINILMPKIFDCNLLKENWVDIVLNETDLARKKIKRIAGWSTGAMLAYAVAQRAIPEELFLLSATPSFCRTSSFRFGIRSSVLDQMICALRDDPDTMLGSFYKSCGLEQHDRFRKYSALELRSGLLFLKQADLHPLSPQTIKPLFLGGRDDEIVPRAASIYFSEKTGGVHLEFGGPHAFFVDQGVEVVRSMEETMRYLDKMC